MKLSKITTALLLGVMTFSSTASALGTRAGTVIETVSSVKYKLGDSSQKVNAPTAKQIVDRIVSFDIVRVTGEEQKIVKGEKLLAPFKVSNMGNSVENITLSSSYGERKDFSFENSVIYIDKNRNGKLEDSERVDSSVIKNLEPDSKELVWVSAVTPKTVKANQKVSFGLKGEAGAKSDSLQESIDTQRYLWSVESSSKQTAISNMNGGDKA